MNSDKPSPMLRYALESFEHGLFHYLDGTPLGRRFALLHVDHAIELIIKERLIRMGKSIFKSDGKTLNLHEAFNSIAREVSLPERPRLEDLHDLRNTVQHKGLALDELTTEFYLTEAYQFVRRFLNEELDIELQAHLPRPFVKAMEGLAFPPASLTEEAKVRLSEAESLYSSGAYEMAVITAFVALEITARETAKSSKPSPLWKLIRQFVDTGEMSGEMWGRFEQVARIRNRVAHTGGGISKQEARKALDDLSEVIESLPNRLAP